MWRHTILKTLRSWFPRHKPAARMRKAPCPLIVEVLEIRDVPAYLVTDLGVSPGFVASTATDINNSGQVVGYEQAADYSNHAFIWQNGVMTDLGTLGGIDSMAFGINDLGQVVGVSYAVDANGNQLQHAFLWQNGVMTDLDPGAEYSSAFGINNLGQIVGEGAVDDVNLHAMLWQNGTKIDLGTLPNESGSTATAINNVGQIVGTSGATPFLWQGGTMTALENAGDSSTINAINDTGVAVGAGTFDIFGWSLYSAVRWEPDGIAYDIGVGSSSVATDINNSGQIIGDGDYPFLVQDGVATDLYDQVSVGNSDLSVKSINDSGVIIGSSNYHAVLLNPVASLPQVSINNVSVTEGNTGTTNAAFTVSLVTPVSWPVTVQYATADDTAMAGSDYVATSGMLTFAPGEISKTVNVPVIGDRYVEPNESYFVNLSAPTDAQLGNSYGVGTIVDDEPYISIGNVSKLEGATNHTTLFTFTVSLSQAYDQAVTVSYYTANGTATTGDKDYVAQSGTLTFAPGQTTKTITITVNGDNKRESNETFYVDLYGLSNNAAYTNFYGTGTILNDD
jgi:probable HAF family extracellular repeat protein